jgi:hypothetical protein
MHNVVIIPAGTQHHADKVGGKRRRMRIQLRVGMRMMQSVHDGVGSGTHIMWSLGDVGENEEKTFPSFTHGKGAVRGVAVVKESLCEKRKIPDGNKKNDNKHATFFEGVNKKFKKGSTLKMALLEELYRKCRKNGILS